MTLDETIKYCRVIAKNRKASSETYKGTDFEDDWKKEAEKYFQIVDWLQVLKDIQSTGCCNTCKIRTMCEYEPETGQMARYNCPFYKGEREHIMTYGDIYKQFCKKFPNAEVSDYRQALPQYLPQLVKPIPYAIIVWLKDGSTMIYIAESEEL